ncbi:MAG TPA: type II toxin-antitoxin system VapC family toxin [Solirubrobacterales bacterium]|nr:type II toxin-antitoxin system VapC family toxin [Solirubrobacterales bacterium]
MTLYLDSSALVKRYVREVGSDLVAEAMRSSSTFKMCRVGYVETERAVARGGGPEDVERMRSEWPSVDFVELDEGLAEHAAALAVHHRLRTLDALHLAAALTLADDDPTFLTWDTQLHRAAREQGLRTLPVRLSARSKIA